MQQSPKSPLEFQGRDISSFHLPVQFHTSALSVTCLFPSLLTPFPGTAASLCMLHSPWTSLLTFPVPQVWGWSLFTVLYLLGRKTKEPWSVLQTFVPVLGHAHGLLPTWIVPAAVGDREVSAGSTVVRRIYHQINNFTTKKNPSPKQIYLQFHKEKL